MFLKHCGRCSARRMPLKLKRLRNRRRLMLSLEDVRGVWAQKSAEGHTAEIQALIRGYGANRLSEVAPEHYAELLQKAEVL